MVKIWSCHGCLVVRIEVELQVGQKSAADKVYFYYFSTTLLVNNYVHKNAGGLQPPAPLEVGQGGVCHVCAIKRDRRP